MASMTLLKSIHSRFILSYFNGCVSTYIFIVTHLNFHFVDSVRQNKQISKQVYCPHKTGCDKEDNLIQQDIVGGVYTLEGRW